MQAYKCDRCGRYFDNYDDHKIVLPGESGRFQWKYIVLSRGDCTPEKRFDVCSICLNDFIDWMLGGGEASNE